MSEITIFQGADAMQAKLLLPPNGRDFEVYSAVRVEDRSTREVAKEFRLSQTRVCQIVERVGQFLLQVTPEGTDEERAKRVALAEQLAAARLQHFQQQAKESFEASKGQQTTTRISQDALGMARTVTTIRQNYGEVRYLDLAARLALRSIELPVATLSHYVVWEEEEAREAGGEATAEESAASELATPAKEDCSPSAAESAVVPLAAAQRADVTANADSDCVRAMLDVLRRNDDATHPVQPETPPANPSLNSKRKSSRREFFAAAG